MVLNCMLDVVSFRMNFRLSVWVCQRQAEDTDRRKMKPAIKLNDKHVIETNDKDRKMHYDE